MRHLLIIMLFPVLGFGQIDLTGYVVTDTAIVLNDTIINEFMDTTITVNGSPVTLYQSRIIEYRSNKKIILKDSGIKRLNGIKEWMRITYLGDVKGAMNDSKTRYFNLKAVYDDAVIYYNTL